MSPPPHTTCRVRPQPDAELHSTFLEESPPHGTSPSQMPLIWRQADRITEQHSSRSLSSAQPLEWIWSGSVVKSVWRGTVGVLVLLVVLSWLLIVGSCSLVMCAIVAFLGRRRSTCSGFWFCARCTQVGSVMELVCC